MQENFISKNGIENAYLYYNIGNSWFYSGELGKAILNYKKAENRLPANNDIKNNLNFARSKVTNNIVVKEHNPLLRTILFLHYDLSFQNKSIIFIIIIFILSLSSIYQLLYNNKNIKNVIIISTIFTFLVLVSLVIDVSKKTEGVIISKEIIARKGDSHGYENSFTSPLYEGLEFTLLSERSGWYQIKLHDGRTCWIPDYSAQMIE